MPTLLSDYYDQYATLMNFCCSVSEDYMDVQITNGTITCVQLCQQCNVSYNT